MRSYAAVIEQAQLMAMAPEAVANYLQQRAAQGLRERLEDSVDAICEQALLSRNDPLISISLARYGRHASTLAALFRDAVPGSGIRLACLSNRETELGGFSRLPLALFDSQAAIIDRWLPKAPYEEIDALFENPTISHSFLIDVLTRSKGCDRIDEDTLMRIVSALGRNPMLVAPVNHASLQPIASDSLLSVIEAAWGLSQVIPRTEPWARILGELYEKLPCAGVDGVDRLTTAGRSIWSHEEEDAERQSNLLAYGSLSPFERVRKGLARLAFANQAITLNTLIINEDRAFRSAAYAYGDLTPHEISMAFERDGALFYRQALRNEAFWRQAATRRSLHDVALAMGKFENSSEAVELGQFKAVEHSFKEAHPEWFMAPEIKPSPSPSPIEYDPESTAHILVFSAILFILIAAFWH